MYCSQNSHSEPHQNLHIVMHALHVIHCMYCDEMQCALNCKYCILSLPYYSEYSYGGSYRKLGQWYS